jgi:O-antigen ligase
VLKSFERMYVVFSLLFFAGGMAFSNKTEAQLTGGPDYFERSIELVIFPLLAIFVIIHLKSVWNGILASGWVLALSFFAVASTCWSATPLFTLQRSIILLATTVFAIYLGARFEWDEQLNLWAWFLALSVLGSLIVIILFPAYGVTVGQTHPGDWKGLFDHKNGLGRTMAFGVLLLSVAKPRGMPSWVRLGVLAGTAWLLIGSHSATSFISVVLIALLCPILHLFRLRRRGTVPLWVAIVPLLGMLAGLVVVSYSSVTAMVGRDVSLTGRTPLWAYLVSAVRESPLIGHGYAAFWMPDGADAKTVTAVTGVWQPGSAHNEYLDLLLDVGLVGFMLFVYGFALAAKRAFVLFKKAATGADKWPLYLLLFIAIYSFTESRLFRSHSFLWLPYASMFTALALSPEQELQEEIAKQVAVIQ